MMGRLHVDLFFQDHYLLNGVDIKVRLVQSKDTFALMAGISTQAYKITIDDAALFAHRVDCKVFSIQRGAMSHTHENIYLEVLPKRVVLCCIDNDAYNGADNKIAFHAKHNNLPFSP